MKREVVYGGIGIVIGSILGFYLDISQSLSFIGLIVFIYIYLKSSKPLTFTFLALALGCFIMQVNENSQSLNLFERASIEAVIDGEQNTSEDFSSYRVKVTNLNGNDINENAILYISQEGKYKPGQIIKSRVKISPLLDAGNPEIFNYKTYMRRYRIYSKLETRSIEVIGQDESLTRKVKNKFYSYIDLELSRGLSEENKRLMFEVFTGVRSLDKLEKDNFSKLGISHLLAISGLHIGIITFFLAYMFSLLNLHKYTVDILSLLILFIYIYIIDFPASAVRAFIMTGFLVFSRILRKAYDPKKALSSSVFIMLILRPYRIFDMGLILSVFASLAMIYKDKLVKIKSKGYIYETLVLSLSVNIFLLPFFINNFKTFNLLTFLANLLIIPLFTISVVSGLLKLIIGIFLPSLSIYIGYFLNQTLEIIGYISSMLLELDIFSFDFTSLGIGLYIFYYFIIFIYINRYDFSNLAHSFKKNLFKIIAINIISYYISTIILDPLEVEFLDVGQGDSFIIRSRNESIMIDTGGSFSGEDSYKHNIRDYLLTLIKDPIPVIISHHDLDHSGNLEYMIEDGLVSEIYTSDYHKDFGEIGLKEGDRLSVGNSGLMVLYDGKDAISSNDSSLVIKLDHHGKSILFTGDAERQVEEELLGRDIKSHILKISHHGSKTSTSEKFLKKVNPRVGIISVGKNNMYSHPNKEVLDRLNENSVEVFRTDESGRIKLVINRFSYYLSPYIPKTISLIDFVILSILLLVFTIIYYDFFKILFTSSRKTALYL